MLQKGWLALEDSASRESFALLLQRRTRFLISNEILFYATFLSLEARRVIKIVLPGIFSLFKLKWKLQREAPF